MATLNSFFGSLLGIEDKMREDIARRLIAALDAPSLLENPDREVAEAIAAVQGVLGETLPKAVGVGRNMASDIVGVQTAEARDALAEGLSQYDIDANRVASQFLIDLASLIGQMQASGMTDEAVTKQITRKLADLDKPFGAFVRNLTGAALFSVQRTANAAMVTSIIDTPEGANADDKWMWVTVGDNRVCKDCEPRHGMVKTQEEWERLGIPKSGFSICEERCRCVIVPADWVDDQNDLSKGPITLKNIERSMLTEDVAAIFEGATR